MVAERNVLPSKAGKKRGKKQATGSASPDTVERARKQPENGYDGVLVLGANLCVAQINALRAQLIMVLEADGPIVIEAAAVETADTATLQLLTAFVNTVRGQTRAVKWRQPSDVLQNVARLLDLDRFVGINGEFVRASTNQVCAAT